MGSTELNRRSFLQTAVGAVTATGAASWAAEIPDATEPWCRDAATYRLRVISDAMSPQSS
jgi:TAT (twin-arginine translocation) pathway signal sequence